MCNKTFQMQFANSVKETENRNRKNSTLVQNE